MTSQKKIINIFSLTPKFYKLAQQGSSSGDYNIILMYKMVILNINKKPHPFPPLIVKN